MNLKYNHIHLMKQLIYEFQVLFILIQMLMEYVYFIVILFIFKNKLLIYNKFIIFYSNNKHFIEKKLKNNKMIMFISE